MRIGGEGIKLSFRATAGRHSSARAARAGFQQYVRDGIQITAGSSEVDIQMTVGAQNETVTVSAESPVLDTTSTTVSMSAGARTVAD